MEGYTHNTIPSPLIQTKSSHTTEAPETPTEGTGPSPGPSDRDPRTGTLGPGECEEAVEGSSLPSGSAGGQPVRSGKGSDLHTWL